MCRTLLWTHKTFRDGLENKPIPPPSDFILEQKALRTGTSTRLDERVFAMCEFKTQPLQQLMRMIYPDLYRLDNMSDKVRPGQLSLAARAKPRASETP